MLAGLALHAHVVDVVDGCVLAGLVKPKPAVLRPDHAAAAGQGPICAFAGPCGRECGVRPRRGRRGAAAGRPPGVQGGSLHPLRPAAAAAGRLNCAGALRCAQGAAHTFITACGAQCRMKKWEKIFAWVAIIGGGIGIFLLSDIVVDLMR